MSISNVKVTRRSLEETLYLGWEIKEAGVHRFEFTVPSRLRDAVILAQMVRSIQRIPENEQPDAPVKCVIELQEDVMGEYRILLQKDSPLPSGPHSVPIPVILTGNVENRFVTLENSGRDELVVDSLKGITQLVRGDLQWVKLQSLLGGKAADVYRVDDRTAPATGADQAVAIVPSMLFMPQSRSVVETASARIGLAQCTLSVDEAGNYRAAQEFRIENTSEAYLELEIPEGTQLWTAMVAGTPVKPIQSPNNPKRAGATRLRLPLIRTQTGDLDYGVELKYAGRLKKSSFMTKLDFPLIESININVELSQVKLLLPENQYWYGFGGTLGQVRDESDFLAGWLEHKNKQISRLSELTTKDSEVFSKARAEENLKQLECTVRLQLGNSRFDLNSNSSLQEQVMQNDKVSNQALAQIAKSEGEVLQKATLDNRSYFNGLLDTQSNYRANGNVDQVGKKGAKSNSTMQSGYAQQGGEKQIAESRSMQPQVAGQMPALLSSEPNTNSLSYQGRARNQSAQAPVNMESDSKDTKELANRYKNKLQIQQQASPVQTAPSFTNDLDFSSNASAPAPSGGGFGGMGFGGMGGGGMGGARTDGRASGARVADSPIRNNFGITPPFGAPDDYRKPMDMLPGANAAPQTVAPDERPGTGGDSAQAEFRKNLSLVVTAPQETEQSYLTSLAITLPTRGKEFYFTTPRGDAILSANGVSKSIVPKSIGLIALVIGVVLLIKTRWAGGKAKGFKQ